MAMSAHHARTHQSLDALTQDEQSPYERHGALDRGFPRVDDRDALRRVLATLSDDDQALVRDYFVDGITQQQIAEKLGVSQMHISRRLRRILRVLAARLGEAAA
jgi:RNA polymerase sigma-B factor